MHGGDSLTTLLAYDCLKLVAMSHPPIHLRCQKRLESLTFLTIVYPSTGRRCCRRYEQGCLFLVIQEAGSSFQS